MMKLKVLVLVVVSAAALAVSVPGAAANPILTSPPGVEYTGTIDLSAEGSFALAWGAGNTTCSEATTQGQVVINNTTQAAIDWSIVMYPGCGVTLAVVLKKGSMRVESGGGVTGSGSEFTVAQAGVSCVYGTTTGTKLGTLKGGSPATLTVSASLPKISGGFLCANPAKWTGSRKVTEPTTLVVH
jgi:hypothetical protein